MMEVLFTASKYGKTKIQEDYDQILIVLKGLCGSVYSPEIDEYVEHLTQKELDNLPSELYHAAYIQKLFKKVDAVVVEYSYGGFALGYEVSKALSLYKPVLGLYKDKSSNIDKIQESNFYPVQYNSENLKSVIEEFIFEIIPKYRSKRVNFLLSAENVRKLDDISKKSKRSKSEIIRSLIEEMQN